jgi:hypothetical protein
VEKINMADLRKYWQELRAIEKGLADFVWLMSLENRAKGQAGGSIAEVAAGIAAKLLHAKSHRLATEEEIAVHRASQEQIQRQTFEKRLRDKGIAQVQVK